MANINPLDIGYFESFANEIEGKFNRLKLLITDRTASGSYHEEILRTILRNFLSKRYSVKTGFVFKDRNSFSSQLDILIIDEDEPASYIFQEGDFVIVIPEAVVATMEVKTRLDANAFDKAISNVASVKKLFKFPTQVTSVVFGYGGTLPSDTNLDRWFKRPVPSQIVVDGTLGPDAIMFFTEGTLLTGHNERGVWDRVGKYYHKLFRSDNVKSQTISDRGWQISIVLAMVVAACEHKDFQISRRFKSGSAADRLIQTEGSMRSHSRFAFGEGMTSLVSSGQQGTPS